MPESTKARSIHDLSGPQKTISLILVFLCGVAIFAIFPPPAIDWRHTFHPVSLIPLHPYDIRTFVNLPWAALILFPLRFFPENLSIAINSSLNLVIIGGLVVKRKGGLLSLALTLTSFPFLAGLANGSIEWIPALGFILQNGWGLALLLTKPQSGFLAGSAWLFSVKKKWQFFLPAIFVVTVAFVLWGNWPAHLLANIRFMSEAGIGLFTVNMSPFPWGIPLGLGILFYVIKYKPMNSEILGVLATLCLVPYFVPHSLTILFALLSVSHRRLSIVFWVLLWSFAVIHNWTAFIQILGIH